MPCLRKHKAAFWVLCLFVVALQLTGVQEHWCLDGAGPRVRLHLGEDVSPHHNSVSQPEVRKPHFDMDVSVAGILVAKRFDTSLDVPVLLAAITLVVVGPSVSGGSGIWADDPQPLPGTLHSYFLPPLRAPPGLTSLVV